VITLSTNSRVSGGGCLAVSPRSVPVAVIPLTWCS
jgi:hypothetical protein